MKSIFRRDYNSAQEWLDELEHDMIWELIESRLELKDDRESCEDVVKILKVIDKDVLAYYCFYQYDYEKVVLEFWDELNTLTSFKLQVLYLKILFWHSVNNVSVYNYIEKAMLL